jgi:hypothetical protein
VLVKNTRDRARFAGFGHQQLLKPATEPANVGRHADPLFAIIWLQTGYRSGDGAGEEAMKILTVLVAMLALITAPAHAQMGGKRHQSDDKKNDQPEKKVDDKAYKAALERIPEPKEKYDPWGVARPAEPAKDTAKKPKP